MRWRSNSLSFFLAFAMIASPCIRVTLAGGPSQEPQCSVQEPVNPLSLGACICEGLGCPKTVSRLDPYTRCGKADGGAMGCESEDGIVGVEVECESNPNYTRLLWWAWHFVSCMGICSAAMTAGALVPPNPFIALPLLHACLGCIASVSSEPIWDACDFVVCSTGAPANPIVREVFAGLSGGVCPPPVEDNSPE